MRVILNADDFGYSTDTVEATIECIDRGIVTSATIMPNMNATEEALDYARGRGGFSFGVHLTLVDDWHARPIAMHDDIPGLVKRDGSFLPTNMVRLRALLGRLPVGQLEHEISAQIGFVASHGISISHVDSHRHLHKLPNVQVALRRVLPHYGISRVRTVQDIYLRRPLASPTVWLGPRWKRELMRSFNTTDHLYMPATTTDRDWQASIVAVMDDLGGDTLEIGVHPGYHESWRSDELQAAESFSNAARRAGYSLVSWADAFPSAEQTRRHEINQERKGVRIGE